MGPQSTRSGFTALMAYSLEVKHSENRSTYKTNTCYGSLTDDKITVSGRLWKSGNLSHDPNIGQLSIISAVLRKLGCEGQIEIIQHGLKQNMVKSKNKFVHLANLFSIDLEGLSMPKNQLPDKYWEYEMVGEIQ